MLSDSDFGSVSGSIRTPATWLKKFTDLIESYDWVVLSVAALWPKLKRTSFVNRTSQELLWRQCYCWSGQFYGSGLARHWWHYNSIHLLHEFEGSPGKLLPEAEGCWFKNWTLVVNKQHLDQLNAWISQVCLKHATVYSVIGYISTVTVYYYDLRLMSSWLELSTFCIWGKTYKTFSKYGHKFGRTHSLLIDLVH